MKLPAPRRALFAIIALYVALAATFSAVFPIFEFWDEIHHHNYVRYLIEERRLPVHQPGGQESEIHQPPGYYLITALSTFYLPADPYRSAENPAFAQPYWYEHNKNRYIHPRSIEGWPWRGTALSVHVARLFSVLWGAVTLVLTYHLALRLQPEGEGCAWFPVGVVGLAAFNGTFLQLTASVNNEVMATVCGTGLSLVLADISLHGFTRRRAVITGILIGLAALTKWTMVPFLGSLLGAVLISAETRRRPAETLRWLAVALAVGALIGGWWYVRNQFVYGEPLASSVLYDAWKEGRPSSALPIPATIYPLLARYWGSYSGYDSVRMPEPVLIFFVVFTAVGVLAIGWRWIARQFSDQDKRVIFVLGSIATGFFLSALVAGSQSRFGIQQRWLMAAHAAASALLALGWWHIMEKAGLKGPARVTWAALPLLASVISLLWLIIPSYAPPRTVADPAELEYETPFDVSVGGFTRLVGASVPLYAEGGTLAWTRLCWQTASPPQQSYWMFVHVIGSETEYIAGIDSIPGRGSYLTSDWQAGTAHCTDWPVKIPDDTLPGRYTVQAGLYDRETLQRLEATQADGTRFDPPVVGVVIVPAAPGSLPKRALITDVAFGGIIRLRGVKLPKSPPMPGEALRLILYWEALAPLGRPYTVFIHLVRVDDDGGMVLMTQADGPPRRGLYPTDLWTVGGLVPDEHSLVLPPDLPGGTYRLRVGLYDPVDGTRLPGPEPDGGYTLPYEINIP